MKINWKFLGISFLLFTLVALLIQVTVRVVLQEWLMRSSNMVMEDLIFSANALVIALIFLILFVVLLIVQVGRKEWIISAALAATGSTSANLVGTLILGAFTFASATIFRWIIDMVRAYYLTADFD